ncbi:MAG: ATP-binding cassette domain-containing protein [Bacteroidales bacterium]
MPLSHAGEIEFLDVSFSRQGAEILHEVALRVEPGDVLALIGRSGAGKTTLLKLTNGLLQPTGGRVLVEGRDTREWEAFALRRRAGYVIQDVGLFPHMTVGQNVGLVPRLVGWPPERTSERVEEVLTLVGLPPGDYLHRWPSELSGGQRQRAGVARALAVDPPILLMDEPFGSLDPITRAEMHGEFTRIQASLRKTVVIVTHDMDEALDLGTRVGVLDGGRLIACGSPEAIAGSADLRVRALLDARPRRQASDRRP